ncbi:DUF3048 domain-containing protein [Patescibacteria group bacterium]|nr:DUF3048 domain-containing protein [Patescibacteria group bacterium]
MKEFSFKYFYSSGFVYLLIVLLAVSFIYLSRDKTEAADPAQEQQAIGKKQIDDDSCAKRKLDGLCLFDSQEPVLFAAMIDNHSGARPQAGLSRANLVFESIVEAPITRFLAVFYMDEELKNIGPIRSARPFFVDWASEFDVPYIHVGGSNEALDILAKSYDYDVNEFSFGQYFWRDNARPQPHNVFISNELINKLVENREWELKNDFESWQYKLDENFDNRPQIQAIKIDFGGDLSGVKWEYDRENNNYLRLQAGKKHLDADGSEIRANNIAVMYVESIVIDDYGRRKVTTIGSGKAIVFRDGAAVEGNWKRTGLDSRTRFFDSEHNEIKFNAGITWIEAVPTYTDEVEYSN